MGREIYRADNLRQVSQPQPVQANVNQREAFLNMRMPGVFTRHSDPQNPAATQISSELTDQNALDVLSFRMHFQMSFTSLQARIQHDITGSLPLDPEEAEEAFVVLMALEDLERFVSAISLQKGVMPHPPRQHIQSEVSGWSVPLRKPSPGMYPVLEYPDMRDMLQQIVFAANAFETWL